MKAIRDKKSVGWPMEKAKVSNGIVYVFVLLNPAGQKPEYFIATSRETRAMVKQYKTRGVINLYQVRSNRFLERWDKVRLGCG